VDEEFELDAALSSDAVTFCSSGISLLNIRPLGHLKRQQLLQRWFELGDEPGGESIEEVEIGYKVLEVERTINTVLGRKLLPSYPVFVLSLLQILESGKSLNTITGSYGYIYETLIASALAKEGGSETLLRPA
jgi:hypothetical protein